MSVCAACSFSEGPISMESLNYLMLLNTENKEKNSSHT
jgi:hypothetical protein